MSIRKSVVVFLHIQKQRRRSAAGYRAADKRRCFRYLDSTNPLLPICEVSSLQPLSLVVQPDLSRTW